MFNLLANTMFAATRLPAPPTAPLRTRWTHDRGHASTAHGGAGDRAGKGGPVGRSTDTGSE